MKKLRNLLESSLFQNCILVLIIFNSILMGVATDRALMAGSAGPIITLLDNICLAIFVVELLLKIVAYNKRFLLDGWNIFDFVIIVVSLIPNMQVFSALRGLRILRVLKSLRALRAFRMVSGLRRLRIIVSAIFESIPGILWTGLLLLLDFYVFAVLGTTMFGEQFADWFGDLGKSFYTLFQVMTLESWSMGISRPVMEVYSWAWLYFVPFVISSAFIVMNVVVGIVVNTISEANAKIAVEDQAMLMAKQEKKKAGRKGEEAADETAAEDSEALNPEEISDEMKLASLRAELAAVKEQIAKMEQML